MGGLDGRKIWQLAAGNEGRSYHEDLIDWNVALIGPGDDGSVAEHPEYYEGSPVRRFADARDGDIVVLKQGLSKAHAIGVLGGPYRWDERFQSVRGWSLQHSRPVRWLVAEKKEFPSHTFGQSRFSLCGDGKVHAWVEDRLGSKPASAFEPPDRDHINAPNLDPWDDPPIAVAEIVARVRTFWEYCHPGDPYFGGHPSEAEVRSHLVVPLLLALGWPRELIAIEWKHMDVALYGDVRRSSTNCRVIVETKTMFSGLGGAFVQAQRYSEKHGPKAAILATDGSQIEWRASRKSKRQDTLKGSLKQPNRATEEIIKNLRYTG